MEPRTANGPGASTPAAISRAAIVLAGGRGSRLGGTSKALLRIDGRPALARVVEALGDAGRSPIVIVGPEAEISRALGGGIGGPAASGDRMRGEAPGDVTSTVPSVRVAIESDRFGGPAVAAAAGVAELETAGVADDVLVDVLACDLVSPTELVAALDAATSSADPADLGADGLVLVDESGRVQWLAACIRLAALARALADAQPGDGIGRRLSALDLARVAAPDGATRDIDTPSDLSAYGAHRDPSTPEPGFGDPTTVEEP